MAEKEEKEFTPTVWHFLFRGEWHDIRELVGETDIFEMKEGRGAKIITRPGIGRLIDFFGNIDVSFTKVLEVAMCGERTIAIEACAKDLNHPENRPGRAFGEASPLNLVGFSKKYPVAMAEKRAKARAVLDLLGVRGVYSEDEADEFREEVLARKSEAPAAEEKKESEEPQEAKKEEKEEKKETAKEVVKDIQTICDKYGFSEEEKLDVYRNVLGDKDLSKSQITLRATIETKKEVRDKLRQLGKSKQPS